MRRAPATGRAPSFAALAIAALVLVTAALVLAGCGGGEDGEGSSARSSAGGGNDSATRSAPEPTASEPTAAPPDRVPAQTVAPSHCPAGLSGCRTTEGRIVYVERIDPDGDGDAHFVVADPQGITLPGLTAIDVRAGLRPEPLPGPGDLISAAGQVQTGSYGQDQIHAVEVHVGTNGGG